MPTKSVYVPPKHLSTKAGVKFDTYRFYLQCIKDSLIEAYEDWNYFARACANSTQTLQGLGNHDEDWIERFLKIAWNTEYLLYVDVGDPEIVRINNQWLPIQSYYCIYAACEALAYAIDGSKANSHQKALKKASAFFVNKSLTPWDKAYKGPIGKKHNAHQPVNFPSGTQPPHNLQRSNVDPTSMLATCLRAEHTHRVDTLWGGKKQSGPWKYEFDPGRTTLLHFLYRLRLKANYQEVDLFVSNAPDDEIIGFAESLRTISSWTLSYVEIVLMRKCKKELILKFASNYVSMNKRAEFLIERTEEYVTLI